MEERTFQLHTSFADGLTEIGKQALHRLSNQFHCDGKILAVLFSWLPTGESVELEKAIPYGEVSRIKITPLDLLDHKAMFGEFNLRKLGQIAKAAKRLQEQIARLKETEFVKDLNATGRIGEQDLLRTNIAHKIFDLSDPRFEGLVSLPELAKNYHPKRKPEFTRTLTEIYQHILERSGGWHDSLVADILNDLFPSTDDCNPQYNETNLKRWRELHGLQIAIPRNKKQSRKVKVSPGHAD